MRPDLADAIRRATQRLKALDRAEFERRLLARAEGGLAADLLRAGVFPISEDWERQREASTAARGECFPGSWAYRIIGLAGAS